MLKKGADYIEDLKSLMNTILDKNERAKELMNSDGTLFEIKMFHEDMISLHNKAIESINELIEKESFEDNAAINKVGESFDYRSKEFWRNQIERVFKKTKHPIKSTEILDSCRFNPSERRQCMSILSNVLSEQCKSGELKRFKIEGEKGFYYALPNMIIKKAD